MAQLDGAAHGNSHWFQTIFSTHSYLVTQIFIDAIIALAFSSGVAGIAAVVQTLKQGDHIVYIQCSNGDSDWLEIF